MMKYTIDEFQKDVQSLSQRIKAINLEIDSVYGVPRGGVSLAMALSQSLGLPLLSEPRPNSLIVDDVIDSGATRRGYNGFHFACLHHKENAQIKTQSAQTFIANKRAVDNWIDYWWEGNERSVENNVIRIIQAIGDDPRREGLKDTPKRVIKMYDHIFSGYKMNEKDVIKEFDKEGYDQIVLLKEIEFYSMCEHHMLPFIGKAHLAYIPNEKIIGISKLAKLLEIYSRRLQIQERLTNQVADAMMRLLKPRAAACIIEARHMCMQMRGVQKQNAVMVTSSLKGLFMDDSKSREELMFLIRG